MFFTIFLSLVAIAVAAEPCKFPKVWTGGADNENYVRGGSFDSFAIAYDADHEQFAAKCTLDADTERERNVTVIALYQKKAYYIFSAEKEKCAVINLDDEFSEWGVPSDAKNLDDYHYGTATETLNVDEFSANIEFRNHTIHWGIDVTTELCVPVVEETVAEGRDRPFMINNVFYYDFEPKVEAKFFVPPSYCPDGVTATKDSPEIQELRERLSFSRAMKLI
eukprot:m.87273 g.87273  ORF g.87273 m.87273 type:complete len:222 (+) comp36539_c0_seq1:402-1067(+)